MFKFALGACVVVALVGYGVITTDDIERAGTAVVNGVNSGADLVKQATDPTVEHTLKDRIGELVNRD